MFEIDVLKSTSKYVLTVAPNGDTKSVLELSKAWEAFKREMELWRRVIASTLEEINVGSVEEPRLLSITKDLTPTEIIAMPDQLRKFKDVFAWSHEDMKGLDPKFYQHKINLATDAKLMQQRRYRMNPNYTTRVKEEIEKLLKVRFIRLVKQATWLSPIVVVPRKNGKIQVCVDYHKLKRCHNHRCISLTIHGWCIRRGHRS